MLPSIQPAKLARSLAAFNDPDWLLDLKHYGFRSLAYIENGQCRLVSRHRNTYKSFETLSHDLARLRVENAILDGRLSAWILMDVVNLRNCSIAEVGLYCSFSIWCGSTIPTYEKCR